MSLSTGRLLTKISIFLAEGYQFTDGEVMRLNAPPCIVRRVVVADFNCPSFPPYGQDRSINRYAMHIESECPVKTGQLSQVCGNDIHLVIAATGAMSACADCRSDSTEAVGTRLRRCRELRVLKERDDWRGTGGHPVNGFGVGVYGTDSKAPISDLVIDGNEQPSPP